MLNRTETGDQPSVDANRNAGSATGNLSFLIFGVLSVLFGMGLAFRVCGSNDLFWQLRTGHEIILNHAVPHSDTYSYTRAGTPWVVHEWLFFVAMWAAYSVGGYGGVWILQVCMVAAICGMLYVVSYRETSGAPLTAMIVTLFAAILAGMFFQPRPQLATYLGVIIVAGVCLAARRENPRRVYVLMPLFLLWSNLHAGVLVGIVLLFLFAGCDAVEMRFRADLKDEERAAKAVTVKHMAVAALIAALLSLATPYGWDVYKDFLATISNDTALNLLGEWQPANFHTGFGKLLEVYIGFIIVVMFASRHRKDLVEIVVLAGLSHEALMYNRNVALLAFIGAVLIGRHVQSAIQRLVWHGTDEAFWTGSALFGRKVATIPTIATATALILLSIVRISDVARIPDSKTSGTLEHIGRVLFAVRTYPERACEFIKQEGFPATTRIYNVYGEGGYIIWAMPEHKVFVDGRADIYFGNILEDYSSLRKLPYDWQRILQDHNCNVILTSTTENQSALYLASSEWAAVYVGNPNLDDTADLSDNSIILIRRLPENANLIRKCRVDCPAFQQAVARYPNFLAFH